MRTDLRVKHDIEARKEAVRLFEAGLGRMLVARELSIPQGTVRIWLYIYRAFGREALLSMDGKQSKYSYEQRVAAASAVVDGGMTKAEAMAKFGIMSPARPTRPPLREAVAEIFSRTPNGCGHRQMAMCLRAELGAHRQQDRPQDHARDGDPL